MSTSWTDQPRGPISTCKHKTTHRHGTNTGYQVCSCRCEDCAAAASAYRKANRERRLRDGARRGGPKALKSKPRPGTQMHEWTDFNITTNPIAAPPVARAAGRFVATHATSNEDARLLLDTLGLTPLLT